MRQIQPDLWETAVESPFPGLTTNAYLLTHEDGNILFYNTGLINEIERMAELGGVARHYLSHREELGETVNRIRDAMAPCSAVMCASRGNLPASASAISCSTAGKPTSTASG